MRALFLIFLVSLFSHAFAQQSIDLGRRSFPALPSLSSPSNNVASSPYIPPYSALAPSSVTNAEAPASGSVATEDATTEQLAAAAARSSPESSMIYNPASQPSTAPSAEGAPVLPIQSPSSISNSSPESHGSYTSSPVSTPSLSNLDQVSAIPNNISPPPTSSFCNAGLAVSHQWTGGGALTANQSLPGTTFVVYLYLSAGRGMSNSTQIPWKLSVQNDNYDNFLQWWNIDDVSATNKQLTGTANQPWETLNADGSNQVDIGFIVNSASLPFVDTSSNTRSSLFPSEVSINNQLCSIYTL